MMSILSALFTFNKLAPDVHMYNIALTAIYDHIVAGGSASYADEALSLFRSMQRDGAGDSYKMQPTVTTYNLVLSTFTHLYERDGDSSAADKVVSIFHEMKNTAQFWRQPNADSYSAVLSVLGKKVGLGDSKAAEVCLLLIDGMPKTKENACVARECMVQIAQSFVRILETDPVLGTELYNTFRQRALQLGIPIESSLFGEVSRCVLSSARPI